MRYAWIEVQRTVYPLDEMCRVLAVSESGYRSWKRGGTPDRTRLTEAQLLALIRAIHAALQGAYGSPRMVRELRGRGFPASKPRVERLMREHGIRARHTRRDTVTTDSTHHLPVAANRLNRDFTPSAPNQTWTSDMTSLWTDEGWLYLAIVLDLFNREVVGWSLKPRMTADRSGPIPLNSSPRFLSGVSADAHAASLPVGSITVYASSGVCLSRLECGLDWLYQSMYCMIDHLASLTES